MNGPGLRGSLPWENFRVFSPFCFGDSIHAMVLRGAELMPHLQLSGWSGVENTSSEKAFQGPPRTLRRVNEPVLNIGILRGQDT